MTGSQACCPAACQPCADCPMPPHPICCMSCPPPIVLPTVPEPVKPLMMPVEKCENRMTDEEQFLYRFANFYNNYNIDWRTEALKCNGPPAPDPRAMVKCKYGVTVDGKNPYVPRVHRNENCCTDKGCPTGFKPCVVKMCPELPGHPCGLWCAEVQECAPKPVCKTNAQRPSARGCTICRIHCNPKKCTALCFNR
ncbi:uncharacterized protein LOC114326492 isoform X2 [Diabrotica virgifera virgifera]|uniref:Uncharacterized protein LOC114326492 isoform X2 n=1 Tax=Diabrotica virgifera virgifera TaxID=50390 RepID=A0A6P7FAV7_DIAVI|nr:uncharacterized protein LOC114326492 isoform X2 [Diabrotica virgifera virgifera]